jgi:hypothetical protein
MGDAGPIPRYHRAMDDRTLIATVGRTLWGADWQDLMADALMQPASSIADWAQGRRPIPAGIWKDLREAARLHALKIADLDPQIVQAYDTAVALASRKGRA